MHQGRHRLSLPFLSCSRYPCQEHTGCLWHPKWANCAAARREAGPHFRGGVRGWHAGQLEPGPVRRFRGKPLPPAGPLPCGQGTVLPSPAPAHVPQPVRALSCDVTLRTSKSRVSGQVSELEGKETALLLFGRCVMYTSWARTQQQYYRTYVCGGCS